MTVVIAHVSPQHHKRHALHDLARDWPETNCYVDLWIEVLNALGHDPVAGLGFTVLQDFEGDQFTFFKFPAGDLEALYGVSVLELSIFDDVASHLETQVTRGRLPLVEVDGFFLPDTKGVSYAREHTKTTVAVNRIDRGAKRLEYFHNAGYFALEGRDFDGLFRQLPEQQGVPDALLPYTEFVKIAPRRADLPLAQQAVGLMQAHMRMRPAGNPIAAYKASFAAHAAHLMAAPPAFFHKYTFNVLRQLGANHELLASHLEWLRAAGVGGLDRAIVRTREISQQAKTMQFQLARSVARRNFQNHDAALDRMAQAYDDAFCDLASVFAGQPRRLAS